MGAQVAGYGSVAARCCRDPLVLVVADAAGSDLHRAALRVADHEKVVVPEADSADVSGVVSGGIEGDVSSGTAYVLGGETVRSATTPDELMCEVAAQV